VVKSLLKLVFRRIGDEIVPTSAFAIPPFTAESLLIWDANTDASRFLAKLFAVKDEVIGPHGRRLVDHTDYGNSIFQEGRLRFGWWAVEFSEAARIVPVSIAPAQFAIPEFANDPRFGLVAKYAIAWKGLIDAVLSNGSFQSWTHLAESDEDLSCSVLMASRLYYKHAIQVLRLFIESLIKSAYFAKDTVAYQEWIAGSFQVSHFRGKGGLLEKLVLNSTITDDFATRISELYSKLSEPIHGAERALVYSGFTKGQWTGRTYNDEKFAEWAECFAKVAAIGVQLMKANISAWESARPRGIAICRTCHKTQFSSEDVRIGENLFKELRCLNCGDRTAFDAEFRPVTITTTPDSDDESRVRRVLFR
jgi:hypothetical protein